jgi:hypothetical protein
MSWCSSVSKVIFPDFNANMRVRVLSFAAMAFTDGTSAAQLVWPFCHILTPEMRVRFLPKFSLPEGRIQWILMTFSSGA